MAVCDGSDPRTPASVWLAAGSVVRLPLCFASIQSNIAHFYTVSALQEHLLSHFEVNSTTATMADRSRSRSPDRGGPPDAQQPPADAPPADGPPGNSGAPGDTNGGAGGEEVKLYVGNLDYGALKSKRQALSVAGGFIRK